MGRKAIVTLCLLMAASMTACSRSYDAEFVNPCETKVTVITRYLGVAQYRAGRPGQTIRTATIAPLSTVGVDDAFQDAAGFTWTVEIKESGFAFQVDDDHRAGDRYRVVIPAEGCPGSTEDATGGPSEGAGVSMTEAACRSAEQILRRKDGSADDSSHGALSTMLPKNGPPDFTESGFDGPVSIAELAAGRVNPPLWKQLLERLKFKRAYKRNWGLNGALASAEVIEFRDSSRALAFHRFATRYACRFANEAFEVPRIKGAVGLEVRMGTGMTADQVSFVRGPRRYYFAIWMYPQYQERSRVLRWSQEANERLMQGPRSQPNS